MIASSDARADPAAHVVSGRHDALARRAQAYFDEEDVFNATYVGIGASMTAGGVLAIARDDDPAIRAFGIPLATVGVIELAVGAIYLGITPGLRTDAARSLDVGDAAFLREERERMQSVEGNFVYYKLVEGLVTASGVGLLVGGAATDHEVLRGVGAGLVIAGFVQLQLEHLTHDVARRYLVDLERFDVVAGPGGGMLLHRAHF